jgi:hypothetical protein
MSQPSAELVVLVDQLASEHHLDDEGYRALLANRSPELAELLANLRAIHPRLKVGLYTWLWSSFRRD